MSARVTEAMVEAALAAYAKSADIEATFEVHKDWLDPAIRAALAAALSTDLGEAEGMVLVPREPTEAMLIDGCAIPGVSLDTGRRMYRAMLAARVLSEREGQE